MATPHPIPSNPRFHDLTGRTFARLTVLFYAGKRGKNHLWHCRCECTQETTVQASNLRTGSIVSCGCFRRERASSGNATHGHSRGGRTTKEYRTWQGMIQRCTNPDSKDFERWGGRGIRVCQRWIDSFEAFLADVGPAPTPSHQLDRHPDNGGHYEPFNVRWTTSRGQARNRRNNRPLTLQGETLCIAEWAERTGIDRQVLCARKRLGWTDERTLTTPVQKRCRRQK